MLQGTALGLQPHFAYDLEAQLLSSGIELEGERQQPVLVTSVNRVSEGLKTAQQVMTLCLQPHHWFYVHGVRVHNKGCFPSWTPVLMSSGEHKRIQEISPQDRVVSWDANAARLAEATVLQVIVFPAPPDLLELVFNSSSALEQREKPTHVDDRHVSLTTTPDHPIYGSHVQGLGSMAPDQTRE
eukprot:gnl/TRDRNA2_/TRDRNA2_174628_c1_seq2.p2 gnl/TRDRNA2_/TRDRNA2_174628_c1~~gnl/TRDRNA2_/TRDRNA2_174628_c1_seq2.p2  ORF type:complete len:184 (-),score=16.64 gnl/TRDRNA2_/TRDRNA2_174628_c1_seq2:675-1226(-)